VNPYFDLQCNFLCGRKRVLNHNNTRKQKHHRIKDLELSEVVFILKIIITIRYQPTAVEIVD